MKVTKLISDGEISIPYLEDGSRLEEVIQVEWLVMRNNKVNLKITLEMDEIDVDYVE